MRMAERDRERVRLILADRTRLGQEASYHEAHLILGRRPMADDRELHLGSRVLVDRRSVLAGGEQDDPADMADLEGGQRALSHERRLHRHLVRPELVEDRDEPVVDGKEAVAEGKAGARSSIGASDAYGNWPASWLPTA